MNKINWKNRLRNPATLLSLIGLVIYLAYKIAFIFGYDPDAAQYQAIYDIFAGILFGIGIITNPNTRGIKDGKPYDEEDKDGKC